MAALFLVVFLSPFAHFRRSDVTSAAPYHTQQKRERDCPPRRLMRPVLGARSNPCRARCVVFGIIRSVGARGGLQSAKRRRECWPGCLEKGLTRTNVVLSRIDEFHPSPPATSPASCQLHPPRPAIYFGKTKCQGCRRAGK